MRLATRRWRRQAERLPGVVGTVRMDRRTKRLTPRLKPGDIALIDHVDVDRVSADALVSSRVAAVVNAAPSTSGRYPNLGPEILLAAGIPLVDSVGAGAFTALREGDVVRVHEGVIYRGEAVIASGTQQDDMSVGAAMAEARAGLHTQLEAFAANTMEYLLRERDLLLDGVGIPEIRTVLEGRHVLVVVRGYDYREDLATLRPYIREYRPVLLGVDGGADALIEAGYRPDLIVGDMDSVSDKALTSGAEVIVHAYPGGEAPGLQRVQDLGVPPVVFPAAGTSEDVALLLADEKGASLIVAVGTHATLVEFLDKGRQGMASTFLTRLRVGGKLVEAKGVSRLYRSRISSWSLLALVLATIAAMGAAILVSSVGQAYSDLLRDQWADFVFWLSRLF
ncbi:MAG TPA: putative cytokinetic ring protein SteA [Mycobacteriales bacterium]|nr:putative cytokinetic ring protein SteA [Mycobacteriales bacterium]